MGIKGLSSFIQLRFEKCLIDHKLCNTDIVIDGNNLLFYLYHTCPKQNASFGGDYSIFCEYAFDVFRLFKRCNINPIIVFDGGLDVGDRKQKTRMFRAKQKLIASIKVKPSIQHRMAVHPLLLRTVFLTVVEKFDIKVVQCQYEADGDIAALARGLKCPVVSNDSDFYVLGIPIIPLALMELNNAVDNGDGVAVQCKLFDMDKFLKFIGHDDCSIFPLMGTILGNDYADSRLFENIYSHIQIPKNKSMNDQHRKILGLLEWLKNQTVEEAIEKILNCVKKIHRIEVEVAIRTSLEAYADETNGEIRSSADLRKKNIICLMEDGLPEWFSRLYVDASIPPWVLEIIVHHKMPYQSQVESVSQKSSFCCSLKILKAIALICWDTQVNNKLLTLWRKHNEIAFTRLLLKRTDFLVCLPELSAVENICVEEKQKLLFDIILDGKIGRLLELPSKLQLVFAAIIHWIRNSQSRIRSYHVDGLILCLIHLSVLVPRIGKIRSLKRLENIASDKAKDDPLMDYVNLAKTTFKLQEISPRMLSHDIDYDREVVHTLAEFQATYYFAHTLHQVINGGLTCASPSEFYWGTFIYNAVYLFKGYDRSVLGEKLFGSNSSTLFQTFQHYTEIAYEMAPSFMMDWRPHGPNKPRKRTKKRSSKAKATTSISDSSSEENDTDDNEMELFGNRFNLLTLA